MFTSTDARGLVRVAFTDATTDLALAVPEPGAARAALTSAGERMTGAVPRAVVGLRQVHGRTVHVVDPDRVAAGGYRGGWEDDAPEADGVVTTEPGVLLAVRVADCVPVLLADPDAGVVGAAHAGRHGTTLGVVVAVAEQMRAAGARDLVAWVGPHVCGACYEVPAEMRDEVAALVPEARAETSWGTPALDLGAGVAAQLRSVGAEVVDAAPCTMEHDDLFSHRRQAGAAGRMAGLVVLAAGEPG